MNRDTILEALVNSCITFSPESFSASLMSENVIVSNNNKTGFYSFFELMINHSKSTSIGKLKLKIEKYNSNENEFYYNFYDELHKFAKLTIVVTHIEEKVLLDVMPF